MDRPQEPPTAGGTPPSAAVVDVPVGGPPNAGVVSTMISATIPSKRKRIPKQFFEAPAAAAASTSVASSAEAPPAAKKGGRMKTKAVGPRGAALAKVRTKAISRIGLAPPPPSKVTTPPPSVLADAPPAPPPPTIDVDKVFDVESTTSYMDMLNESAPKYAQARYKDMAGSKNKEFQFHHCLSILQHLPKWKLRDNESKCKKEALLTMDDEAEDMSGRNAGKPEGNKKAKERVKVEGEAASFRKKLDQLMKSKEALTMKTLETKLIITEKKKELKLAKVQARREDAKLKAELDMKMIALKEAKAMKELLAEERDIMMMRTDGMDKDQLAWWNETKADIMARKKVAREAREASARAESPASGGTASDGLVDG
nr:chromatin-remodeling ATPase INO80-like [Lolium perenne]